MENKEFTKQCLKTLAMDHEGIATRLDSPMKHDLIHGAMGVSTEANELLDMVKKHVFYGKPLDIPNLIEEVGDTLWYCALLLEASGSSFDEAQDKVIKKLQARYKGKGFSEENAITRDLDTEREILEEPFIPGQSRLSAENLERIRYERAER